VTTSRPARRVSPALLATVAALAGAACGPRLDVGSDLLWTASHESGDFSEWMQGGAGDAIAFPSGNTVEVSSETVRSGSHAAKLTISPGADGQQHNAVLQRLGELPREAFYSAWYYLPRSVAVRTFWVIFKFQMQSPATGNQLYDLDLVNLPSGEMSLMLYDHRSASRVTLDVTDPVVPVGRWFQLEAFYRNANDASGRATFWLDGRAIVDIVNQPMAPTSWVEWDACSVGENLDPVPAVIFVDDAAISRTRVGPTGHLTAPE
jgi:hypothetical protein